MNNTKNVDDDEEIEYEEFIVGENNIFNDDEENEYEEFIIGKNKISIEEKDDIFIGVYNPINNEEDFNEIQQISQNLYDIDFLNNIKEKLEEEQIQIQYICFKCKTEEELNEIGYYFFDYYKNYNDNIKNFLITVKSGTPINDKKDQFILILEYPREQKDNFLVFLNGFQYYDSITEYNYLDDSTKFFERKKYILPKDLNKISNMPRPNLSYQTYSSLNIYNIKKDNEINEGTGMNSDSEKKIKKTKQYNFTFNI